MGNIIEEITFPVNNLKTDIISFLNSQKRQNKDKLHWKIITENSDYIAVCVSIPYNYCDCYAHNRMVILLEECEERFPDSSSYNPVKNSIMNTEFLT